MNGRENFFVDLIKFLSLKKFHPIINERYNVAKVDKTSP